MIDKLDAVAHAMVTARRLYRKSTSSSSAGDVGLKWRDMGMEHRGAARQLVTSILDGSFVDQCPRIFENELIVGVVRCMAASLGMKVVYPAAPARDGMPPFPRTEIDWSTGARKEL